MNLGMFSLEVRVIPLHLQKLFARLMMSDRQSVSTTELTDSFGWTNNEVCTALLDTYLQGVDEKLNNIHTKLCIHKQLFVIHCTISVNFPLKFLNQDR